MKPEACSEFAKARDAMRLAAKHLREGARIAGFDGWKQHNVATVVTDLTEWADEVQRSLDANGCGDD